MELEVKLKSKACPEPVEWKKIVKITSNQMEKLEGQKDIEKQITENEKQLDDFLKTHKNSDFLQIPLQSLIPKRVYELAKKSENVDIVVHHSGAILNGVAIHVYTFPHPCNHLCIA